MGERLQPDYVVYDGALGNNGGVQLVKQTGLHLISKLRHNSTLYFPYAGAYSGKGKPKKYGDRFTVEGLTESGGYGKTHPNPYLPNSGVA